MFPLIMFVKKIATFDWSCEQCFVLRFEMLYMEIHLFQFHGIAPDLIIGTLSHG